MKHPYVLSVLLALLPAIGVALLMSSSAHRSANAAAEPLRCSDSSLYFPANGLVGWTYEDPASTDTDAEGNRTVHTGVDIHGEGGDGAPVFAPADGVVSRQPGSDNVSLLLPGVTNVLTGEAGIELYVTHLTHSLAIDQEFSAGDVIGAQLGDHIHYSVGAFIGYDDREIDQTQDPSPYFNAALGYNPDTEERQNVAYWCNAAAPVASTEAPVQEPAEPAELTQQTHIVQSGDTLSAIAETYGVTIDELAAANGLTDLDYLSIDQELVIPGGGSGGAPAGTLSPSNDSPAEPPAEAPPEDYLIQEGDSLYSIAEQFGTDVDAIVALNGLDDPDVIAAGDYLKIP